MCIPGAQLEKWASGTYRDPVARAGSDTDDHSK